MDLTKEQLSELKCKHSERENGLQYLMEIMLESLMVSERREYLREEGLSGNKCNGYRRGRTYGHGRTLTFRMPRDRYGNFHPRILAILRDQEEECERLAGTLYTKGLTQEQVGEVFIDCVHTRSTASAALIRKLSMSSLQSRRTRPGKFSASATSLRKAPLAGERCSMTYMSEE